MSIIRNTAYNVAGLGLPLLAALVCIPYLIAQLGAERFGILTLIWAVVSYFGIFDLGMARALTQRLAALRRLGQTKEIAATCNSALLMLIVLSLLGALSLFLAAGVLVGWIGGVSRPEETVSATRIVALSLPAVILTAGYRGILEAFEKFKVINIIRLPQGLFTFVAPAVLLALRPRAGLDEIALVLALGRYGFLGLHQWACSKATRRETGAGLLTLSNLRQLLVQGGWITVSNVISQMVSYTDRFVIGAVITAQAVALFVTPLEIVLKLWIVPGALTAVLFPRMAQMAAQGAGAGADLYRQSLVLIGLVVLPLAAAMAIYSREILLVWISAEFARDSALVMSILACGMLMGCFGQIGFTQIQGLGQAKWTALIYIVQLPLYVAAVWWAASSFGIAGVAWAWFARVVIDTLAMNEVAQRLMRHVSVATWILVPVCGLTTAALMFAAHSGSVAVKHIVFATVLAASLAGLLRMRRIAGVLA